MKQGLGYLDGSKTVLKGTGGRHHASQPRNATNSVYNVEVGCGGVIFSKKAFSNEL